MAPGVTRVIENDGAHTTLSELDIFKQYIAIYRKGRLLPFTSIVPQSPQIQIRENRQCLLFSGYRSSGWSSLY